ncbi:193_t:CDS:2, partial [Paraglomus occultum]
WRAASSEAVLGKKDEGKVECWWETGRMNGSRSVVSSHGSQLPVSSILDGTEGAHGNQTAIVVSTNRRKYKKYHSKRRTAVVNASTCGAWKQIRWNDSALPSPPTFFHVSAGNECGQPHGRQSRANSRAEKVFVRS